MGAVGPRDAEAARTRCKLQSLEAGHELVGRELLQRAEVLPERLLGRHPLVPCPGRFQQGQTQQPFTVDGRERE